MTRLSKSQGISLAKPVLLILAISANSLLRAAVRAGFDVYCLDCFADQDSCSIALACGRIAYQSGRWDMAAINQFISHQVQDELEAIVIGSGFEQYPEQLLQLDCSAPVFANSQHCYQRSANFCSEPSALPKGVSVPLTTRNYPQQPVSQLLIKHTSGCGGESVRFAEKNSPLQPGEYFQHYIEGEVYSATVLATQTATYLLGINRIWVAETAASRFQYGGAVSACDLGDQKNGLIEILARQLSREFPLIGLAGFDFIIGDDEQIYLIDINPRPTASFEFYDDVEGRLFQAHLNAYMQSTITPPQTKTEYQGHKILYAKQNLRVKESMQWPSWTSCIPTTDARIQAGDPVCVIAAAASEQNAVCRLLDQRQQQLQQIL